MTGPTRTVVGAIVRFPAIVGAMVVVVVVVVVAEVMSAVPMLNAGPIATRSGCKANARPNSSPH